MALSLQYQAKAEINITPSGSATWATLSEGFTNISEALNEAIYQASYLGDAGWGSSEITGGQLVFTLTGKRVYSDEAQDYLCSSAVKYGFGEARKTQLRLTRGNGVIILLPVTIANLTDLGGDANQPSDISVEFHGNGAPTIVSDGETPDALTLTSTVPAADATGVSRSASITVAFSNRIIADNIYLVNSSTGTILTTTKAWDATGKILTITPSSTMAATARHGIIISGVKDAFNQTLENTLRYFTTGA